MPERAVIAYLVATATVLGTVALATALHAISRRLWRSRWNASELWLALCSAILVATLRRIYPTCFPVLGTEGIWRPEVPLLVAAASIPAAALAAFVRPGSPRPLVIGITIGICMEIPQRLLAQNIFVVFGPGRALVGPLPLSVALTALLWVQFIVLQEAVARRPIKAEAAYECAASAWFSIWVGLLYARTGNIALAMAAHGFEKVAVHVFRRVFRRPQGRPRQDAAT